MDPIPELILNDEVFRNGDGTVKLKLVKQYLEPNLTKNDIDIVKDLYKEWRDTVELMPMRLTYKESIIIDARDINTSGEAYSYFLTQNRVPNTHYRDFVFFDKETMDWQLKKSCKRGNDVYIRLFEKKYNESFKELREKTFFSTTVNRSRKRVRKTQLLYVTGTVAHRFCANCGSPSSGNICEYCGSYLFTPLSLSDAWLTFGKYWNSFVTNIREQFKGAEFFRVWQSQENGYPHFHALVYFPEFKFTAVHWTEKDGSKSWRIHNRQKLKGKLVRERLKDSWKWGHLDVKCCDSLKKAKTDLLKYIKRDLEGGESDLTNALIWFYRKQSYAVSRRFFECLGVKDIAMAEPCNDDLINAEGVITRNNSKKTLVRIEVFPLIRRDIMDFSYTKDVLDPWKMPDPPPNVVNFLENFVDQCQVSKLRIDSDGVEIIVYKRSGV